MPHKPHAGETKSLFRLTDEVKHRIDHDGESPAVTPNLGCKICLDGGRTVLRNVFGGVHIGFETELGDDGQ